MKIDLTADELAFFNNLRDGLTQENLRYMPIIFDSLQQRHAIPEIRLKLFYDADYAFYSFRGKSHFQNLDKNNNETENVYENYAFFEWLNYFIFGAILPDELKFTLDETLNSINCKIDNSERLNAQKQLRTALKKFNMPPYEKTKNKLEIYRYLLEKEIYHSTAKYIAENSL